MKPLRLGVQLVTANSPLSVRTLKRARAINARPASLHASFAAGSVVCTPMTLHVASTAEDDDMRRLAASVPSDDSFASSPAVGAASLDDDASSLTLPSLPSLISAVSSFSGTTRASASSHLCLSSIKRLRPASSSSAATAPALAVSADSSLLYSASESGIIVLDLASARPVEAFAAVPSAGSVKSAAVSPDGTLFTAHQDGRISVWRRSTRSGRHRLDATLPTVVDRLRRFPFPGSYVAVRRHKKLLWIEHADAVSAVAASRGGLLYSVSWDKTLKVWRAGGNLRCLESVGAHDDAVNAVAVAADGTVYTGSADGKIKVWARPPTGRPWHGLVATLDRHRSAVNAVALSDDGSVLYSGACDRSILVWEREESADHMAVAGALRGHEKAILCLACAGRVLFSGSGDRTVRIWRREGDGGGYSCLGVMEGHATGVRSLVAVRVASESDADEDEYRVCSGSWDGEVKVWRVRISPTKLNKSESD